MDLGGPIVGVEGELQELMLPGTDEKELAEFDGVDRERNRSEHLPPGRQEHLDVRGAREDDGLLNHVLAQVGQSRIVEVAFPRRVGAAESPAKQRVAGVKTGAPNGLNWFGRNREPVPLALPRIAGQ